MNFDITQVDQMVNKIPYPVSTSNLKQMAQQLGGGNPQITAVIDRLPEKTYNSSDELKSDLQKNLGNLGNMGGFKL
jgi:hypothetical protein